MLGSRPAAFSPVRVHAALHAAAQGKPSSKLVKMASVGGNSGSPVFARGSHEAVGIVWGTPAGTEAFSHVIPMSAILSDVRKQITRGSVDPASREKLQDFLRAQATASKHGL